jgi:hypothetical protein
VCRYFRRSGLRCGHGVVVRRRLMGVSTGGVPWSLGKHCLYTNGDSRTTRLGTVVNMFYGEDDMEDDFVIFQLQAKQITGKMGHYCTFSDNSQGMDMVDSSKIAWKCKLLVATGANSGMALPYASCTPKEEVELY